MRPLGHKSWQHTALLGLICLVPGWWAHRELCSACVGCFPVPGVVEIFLSCTVEGEKPDGSSSMVCLGLPHVHGCVCMSPSNTRRVSSLWNWKQSKFVFFFFSFSFLEYLALQNVSSCETWNFCFEQTLRVVLTVFPRLFFTWEL